MNHFSSRVRAALAFAVIFANISSATTYKKLYNFTGNADGSDPATPLTFDS